MPTYAFCLLPNKYTGNDYRLQLYDLNYGAIQIILYIFSAGLRLWRPWCTQKNEAPVVVISTPWWCSTDSMASTPVWRAFDSNLIDSVHTSCSKPVLYNTRLKEFRNNKIKENAWKAVAVELEESGRHQCQSSVQCS